ncbi:DUF4406 domain-containing protein [Verminephrobacter aporrectodeae subsp. tuberculatae]|uniref:DUF4406 domain-containing protein n=2 Tax=Verminephrobacter TaxID=364316 RepID=A0ABT3KMX2_9BURK|nr:DUF4406 domain-containing protein [Verminephrobacter aporrectodeae subsp. tuberculatae]
MPEPDFPAALAEAKRCARLTYDALALIDELQRTTEVRHFPAALAEAKRCARLTYDALALIDEWQRTTEVRLKRQRIYISGPMMGLPGSNFPAFHAEADRLRNLGYTVLNPAEINPNSPTNLCGCMRRGLTALLTCDTLALLDGWQRSHEAHLEMHVAHRVGIEIVVAKDVAA